jgi:hypothetical protein
VAEQLGPCPPDPLGIVVCGVAAPVLCGALRVLGVACPALTG